MPARYHQLRAYADQEKREDMWSRRPGDADRAECQTGQGESKDHRAAHQRPREPDTRGGDGDGQESQ